MKTYMTCTGECIVVDNIDAVSSVSCNQLYDDRYIIYMKGGNKINISKGRDYSTLIDCRARLIQAMDETYTIKP